MSNEFQINCSLPEKTGFSLASSRPGGLGRITAAAIQVLTDSPWVTLSQTWFTLIQTWFTLIQAGFTKFQAGWMRPDCVAWFRLRVSVQVKNTSEMTTIRLPLLPFIQNNLKIIQTFCFPHHRTLDWQMRWTTEATLCILWESSWPVLTDCLSQVSWSVSKRTPAIGLSMLFVTTGALYITTHHLVWTKVYFFAEGAFNWENFTENKKRKWIYLQH